MAGNLYKQHPGILLLCIILLIVNSCASVEPSKGTYSTPEITIDNVSSKQVVDIIAEEMRNNKFKIYSLTDSKIIVGRKSGQELISFAYGSSFYGIAEERIVYNIIKIGNSVKVTADILILANPETSFEKITSLNNTRYAQSMQASLDSLKTSIQQNPPGAQQERRSAAAAEDGSATSTSAKSQLDICIREIQGKTSISAKVRAAAQLYNDGKISKEDRNRLQAAILKGEL